jgi:hypothetical protein
MVPIVRLEYFNPVNVDAAFLNALYVDVWIHGHHARYECERALTCNAWHVLAPNERRFKVTGNALSLYNALRDEQYRLAKRQHVA